MTSFGGGLTAFATEAGATVSDKIRAEQRAFEPKPPQGFKWQYDQGNAPSSLPRYSPHSSKVYVMSSGKIVEVRSPLDLFPNPHAAATQAPVGAFLSVETRRARSALA